MEGLKLFLGGLRCSQLQVAWAMLAASTAMPTVWAQEYLVADLGIHFGAMGDGHNAFPIAVNESGLVLVPKADYHPPSPVRGGGGFRDALWSDGRFELLGLRSARANWDVNDDGALGGADLLDKQPRPFLGKIGEAGGVIHDGPGYVQAINNARQAVGYLVRPDGPAAFFWDGAATVPLEVQAGSILFHELSDAATPRAVGMLGNDGSCEAFTWTATTGVQRLESGIARQGDARDVNAGGRVVGWSGTDWPGGCSELIYASRGFLDGRLPDRLEAYYWENGVFHPLTRLDPRGQSAALGVNDRGDIVGFEQISDGRRFAALWRNGEQLVDLNGLPGVDPDWTLHTAWDINERGQIVGWGRYRGQERIFLLTPADLVNAADLVVEHSPSGEHWQVGGEFELVTTVENRGPMDASVILAQTVAPEISFQGLPAACRQDAFEITCELGPISAGARATLELPVRAERPGTSMYTVRAETTDGPWIVNKRNASQRVPLPITRSGSHDDATPPIFVFERPVVVPAGEVLDPGSAMDVDGETIVIGAPKDTGPSHSGAVYLFEQEGATWQWRGRLVADDPTVKGFGVNLDLLGDRLAVAYDGGAYLFEYTAGRWEQLTRFTDPDADSRVYSDVALDADRLVVTAGRYDVLILEKRGDQWLPGSRISMDLPPHLIGAMAERIVLRVNAATSSDRVLILLNEGGEWQREWESAAGDSYYHFSYPYLVESSCVYNSQNGQAGMSGGAVIYKHQPDAGWVALGGRVYYDGCGGGVRVNGNALLVTGQSVSSDFLEESGLASLWRIGGDAVDLEAKVVPKSLTEYARFASSVALSDDTLVALSSPSAGSLPVYAFTLANSPKTADVSVSIQQPYPDIGLNEQIDLTLQATNLSDTEVATGIDLVLKLPSQLVPVSADRCVVGADSVICRVADLAPRDNASVTVAVAARAPGQALSSVAVRTYELDLDKSNNNAELTTHISTDPPPRVTVTPPSNAGDSIVLWRGQTLAVEFSIENWPMAEGGNHYHWQVDDGALQEGTEVNPIMLTDLAEGTHTFRVELATVDHKAVRYTDSITFGVSRPREPTVTYTQVPDPVVQHPAGIARVYYQMDYAGLASGPEDFLWTIRSGDGQRVVNEGALTDDAYFELPALEPGTYVLAIRYKDAYVAEQTQLQVESATARGPALPGATSGGGGGSGWLESLLLLALMRPLRRATHSRWRVGAPGVSVGPCGDRRSAHVRPR